MSTKLSTGDTDSALFDRAAAQDPVFILGMHRSGTTLLYEMLSGKGLWNTLWAWHVANFDEIKAGDVEHQESQAGFLKRLREAGMETRGVDDVKAGPRTKEEYCFIMDNKGLGSKLTPRGLAMFEEICQTVQSTFDQPRPLLLKNPWDFGNAHVIRQLIPSARFVYIHRNPVETINSMWRFLNDVFQTPNPYMAMMSDRYRSLTGSRLRYGLLSRFVRHMPGTFVEGLMLWFGRQCRDYLRSIDQIPESHKVEVTYDALCSDPNGTIRQICQHLNVPDDATDYSSMISRRSGKIDLVVSRKSAKIERRMQAYLQRTLR